MKDNFKELLVRSFDQELTAEENQALSEALKSSPELREYQHEHILLRSKISEQQTASFGPSFSNSVMQGIGKIDESGSDILFESIYNIFRPVAIAASILIISLSSYHLLENNDISLSALLNVPDVTLEETVELNYNYYLE